MTSGAQQAAALLLLLFVVLAGHRCFALYPASGVLLLDHLNLNHQKGRHDLLRSYYFDMLGLVLDPRKQENADKGRKTLWANAGITQFHLPEEESAQVFDGVVTLSYTEPSPAAFEALKRRLTQPPALLDDTHFTWVELSAEQVAVRDPWGSCFVIKHDPSRRDARGSQPGVSLDGVDGGGGIVMSDVTVNLPKGKTGRDVMGVAKFYEHVFGTPVVGKRGLFDDTYSVSMATSPQQTLTIMRVDGPQGLLPDPMRSIQQVLQAAARNQLPPPVPQSHEGLEWSDGGEKIVSNTGPHISLYIQDFAGAYKRAEALGSNVLFTNTRFKRQATSLAEAQEQSMFRVLDVVDPSNPAAGPIFRLEHECRSVLGKDGKTLYKSCPFREVPADLVP